MYPVCYLDPEGAEKLDADALVAYLLLQSGLFSGYLMR